MSGIARHHAEWLSLVEVSGPFLTPPVLIRAFPQGLPKVDGKKLGRLRAAYEEWANAQDAKASDAGALHTTWVQLVLDELLEFEEQTLRSGDGLPANLTVPLAEHRETLQPSVAIVEPTGRARAGTPRLLVSVWPSDQDLETAVPVARWAATPLERMTQLCRSTGIRLGLVTNGERWTLVDAPVGQTAGYASWYAGLWLQEPITLAAFEALLGVRRFFAVADTDTTEALLDESVAFQQEVTDQLGYQVRRAVEVLVQALDRADLDRNRELLRDVPPARLYDAALTVMMRLVFLFCAEERGLLLLGDETYDANYAVSTLRALLREEADRVGVEVLERRQDAWARLLATFRAVHGGIEHEALRLPALGGSLFDPDRFPFLEGRAAGTSWREEQASPLPIDNRTVLHLLEALQLLRSRGDGGRTEARKLSYRALDIEQIGHVYEGLLDHVAVRVDADTLGLAGTKDKEPELSIDELDRERHRGKDELIAILKEHTGRSASALRNDLDAALDEDAQQRLLVACGNDKALLKRIAPYHALLRADVWGYPQIYRANSFMVTGGPERRQTGTHYTPKSLTEQIVAETLEPVVYVGPAEGKPRDAWKLRSAADLLDLKICDMAMGSGAFLVQVCRWLAERVVEAWEEAERQGAAISAYGEVIDKAAGRDLLSPDREERLSFARRLVAERCVYGVDINPMAVELAKLSLWLVTLAKGRPFGFLDHNLRSGDSLLGITNLEQLENFHLDPLRGKNLHHTLFDPRHDIQGAVTSALELRERLRATAIRDIEDVRAMSRLDEEAKALLRRPELAADLLVGSVIATAGMPDRALDERLVVLADQVTGAMATSASPTRLEQEARKLLDLECPERLLPRRPFHWAIEFPEVFTQGRCGFDAIVGNPPFLGGKQMPTVLGPRYCMTLKALVTMSTGAADLIAYFFRRAFSLLRTSGHFGLIATKSIAETATRKVGLDQICAEGGEICSATTNVPWMGAAAVVVSWLHISRGGWNGLRLLNGRAASLITSSLSIDLDFSKAKRLNHGVLYSQGTTVYGDAFTRMHSDVPALVAANPGLRPYLRTFVNGDVLNGDPKLLGTYVVIDFGDRNEDQIEGCDQIISELKRSVGKERANQVRQIHEHRPWLHWDKRTAFYRSARKFDRILASVIVSKHLIFSFVDPRHLFAHGIKLFADRRASLFACLQSGIHDAWVMAVSSKLGQSNRYSTSTSFDTFPLLPEALGSLDLERTGERYHKLRAEIVEAAGEGLTKIYGRFHSASEASPEIRRLRSAQQELDEAVAAAYGWRQLELAREFQQTPSGVRFLFRDVARHELCDRLLALNQRLATTSLIA
jgi:hypothetical protein